MSNLNQPYLTADEIQKIKNAINEEASSDFENKSAPTGYGYPIQEEKHNAFTFWHKVTTMPSTTRVGNLTIQELGTPFLTLRALKDCEHIAKHIMGNRNFASMFEVDAENVTETSLSKDGKLLGLPAYQRRELSDGTKPKVVNKGWFGQKEVEGGSQ